MGIIRKYITDPIREAVADLRAAVVDEIRQQIPVIIKAVVIAVAETVGDAAVNGVDKLTDAIPGETDDQIIDPLVARARETLRRLTGLNL